MRRALSVYRRTARTYAAWARVLLPLAVVVFVPLGLIHALPVHADVTSLDPIHGVEVLVLAAAVVVLATTGLIGEVFYTGAVSIALAHPEDGPPRSMREIARMVNYRTLIAIDLLYGFGVALGLVALIVPGVLIYIYGGLAAPAAEIERRGVRDAFARSFSLVRGDFWLVFWVLVPIELASNAITRLATAMSDRLFDEWLLSEWMADTISNIVLTPFYAVAAVLLTLDLVAASGGKAPPVRAAPPVP